MDDCPASPWASTGIPNLDWDALRSSSSKVSLPESYTSSCLGTLDLSLLTMIALIGCIQTSLSYKGTSTCLHRP